MAVTPILPSQTADSHQRVAVRQAANTYGAAGAVRKCTTQCTYACACVMEHSKEKN